LRQGPKVNYVRPSIDVTMKSLVCPPVGNLLTGVLLTGMGNDGASGISHIKRLGGITIAQEESSCPVFGMPKEAIRTGDVDYVLIPERIAEALSLIANASSSAQLEMSKKGSFKAVGRTA
jgi:two-component system chemotaxis response regulator CheB